MPNEESHILLAKHNQEVIDHLLCDLEKYSDWITTIAFYKALHIVEAVFFNDKNVKHGHSHEDRDTYLKTNRKFLHIYRNYRPLWASSMIARYLENPESTKDFYSCFNDYLPPEKVKSEIIDHRLRQIEKSAQKLH